MSWTSETRLRPQPRHDAKWLKTDLQVKIHIILIAALTILFKKMTNFTKLVQNNFGSFFLEKKTTDRCMIIVFKFSGRVLI